MNTSHETHSLPTFWRAQSRKLTPKTVSKEGDASSVAKDLWRDQADIYINGQPLTHFLNPIIAPQKLVEYAENGINPLLENEADLNDLLESCFLLRLDKNSSLYENRKSSLIKVLYQGGLMHPLSQSIDDAVMIKYHFSEDVKVFTDVGYELYITVNDDEIYFNEKVKVNSFKKVSNSKDALVSYQNIANEDGTPIITGQAIYHMKFDEEGKASYQAQSAELNYHNQEAVKIFDKRSIFDRLIAFIASIFNGSTAADKKEEAETTAVSTLSI